jgi:hypothetical protein
MSEACQHERRLVEIYDWWINFHNDLYLGFMLEEASLFHEVHEACPAIEFETPPECAAARSKLREHQFWKMEPLARTIAALHEKREELRQNLETCEHAAKGGFLI